MIDIAPKDMAGIDFVWWPKVFLSIRSHVLTLEVTQLTFFFQQQRELKSDAFPVVELKTFFFLLSLLTQKRGTDFQVEARVSGLKCFVD